MRITKYIFGCFCATIPAAALAADGTGVQQSVQHTGVSAIWVLANISYAGMRAQNSPSSGWNNPTSGWRVVSFIVGFPGTLLTYFVVAEGSERAYGIDIPKKR
jgi:hypothetical protein